MSAKQTFKAPLDELRGALSGLPLFCELRPDVRSALQEICFVKRYSAGQTVAEEGEPTDFVGCVLSGFLRMQKTLADGRQHIVGLIVEGDLFGRVFDHKVGFAIEAATDVEFCAFPRRDFEAILTRYPEFDRVVLLNILNELDRARDWMVILSNQTVASRVAGFLLMMCTRFARVDHILTSSANGIEVKIPISRTDLAHLLGARTESISRGLHALADDGDIEILAPDRILIRDFEALAARTGEEGMEFFATLKDALRS